MFLVALLLAGIFLAAISLQKTYRHVPIRELKRQANQGDKISKLFYRVVAYDGSLDVLLWTVIGLSGAGFFVFVGHNVSWPVAFIVSVLTIWVAFAWLPGSHISRPGVVFARIMAKPLIIVLEWLHTPMVKIFRFISKYRPVTVHTGLYTKDDLMEFIDLQKTQIDNRIKKSELELMSQSLQLGDKKVGDIMTPWKQVKLVATHDAVGPILMDELHASGHTHFPVYEGSNKKDIVGVLDAADMLDAKKGGFVKDVMNKRVYYLHEDEMVSEAFNTFAETKHPLFIVISNREELVGVLSIAEVLLHMLGEIPSNEFGHHGDRAAVSKKKQPKPEVHVDAEVSINENAHIKEDPKHEPAAKEKEEKTETKEDK